jgi:hypothetical protein
MPDPGQSISKTFLFETDFSLFLISKDEGYRLVSKLVAKSKYQNLTNVMSFDTIVILL